MRDWDQSTSAHTSGDRESESEAGSAGSRKSQRLMFSSCRFVSDVVESVEEILQEGTLVENSVARRAQLRLHGHHALREGRDHVRVALVDVFQKLGEGQFVRLLLISIMTEPSTSMCGDVSVLRK